MLRGQVSLAETGTRDPARPQALSGRETKGGLQTQSTQVTVWSLSLTSCVTLGGSAAHV